MFLHWKYRQLTNFTIDLDPKPFIRTFESTLRELNQLSMEAASKRSQMEKEVSKYELDHSRNVLSLTSRTESVNSQFKHLDDRISKVNSNITPLSQSLTKTINAKERSIATISLVRIYNDFYQTGASKELDSLMNGSLKDKRKCSATVAQLLSLSQKLVSDDLQNSSKCHEIIQKYSESMENSLLEEFNIEYRSNNLSKMKDISDILTDFNGGIAVIKNFVNQHAFFLNDATQEDSLNEKFEKDGIWEKLSDPLNHQVLTDLFKLEIFKEIEDVIQNETGVIVDVFREPIAVLQVFVQRIFAQQIQSKIEQLLKNSYATSTLAYLRTLNALYITTGNFTKDLKVFFQSSLSGDGKLDELNIILDQSFSDLFTSHLIDSKYFDLEKKTLESIFYTITSKYEQLNEAKIQNKLTTRLHNATNSLESNNEYENLNRRSRVGQLKNFMRSHLERSSSFKDRRASDPSLENHHNQEEAEFSKLNLEHTDNLLKSTVESLSRLIELTPTKMAEHGLEILEILLIGIGKSYVDLALEVSFSELHHQDFKYDYLDFAYLNNINISSEILYLVSTCIRTIILPLSNNSPQIKQRMINLTNGYIARVELAINVIMRDTITLTCDKVTHSLSKQKKKDFLPKVGELIDTDTIACEQLSTFLSEVNSQLTRFLNGGNLEKILLELGYFTFNQLFEHFKMFQINSTGGIVVTKDIISYQTSIEEWKIPELTVKFQLLREIANLFTVQPELLNSLTKEGQLATVKPYIIRQFIMKRSDYSSNSYVDRLVSIPPAISSKEVQLTIFI